MRIARSSKIKSRRAVTSIDEYDLNPDMIRYMGTSRRVQYHETKTRFLIELHFVETTGAPGSCYEWNNAAHAAVHSILAALMSHEKRHVRGWLKVGLRQLSRAVAYTSRRNAKALPVPPPLALIGYPTAPAIPDSVRKITTP